MGSPRRRRAPAAQAIADGIDRFLEAAQHDDESGSNVIRFGGSAGE